MSNVTYRANKGKRERERITTRDNDNQQQNDDSHNDPDPHLDILPPHLLSDAVGAATEALGGLVQVLGLVLQLVDVLAALGDGFQVFLHHVYRVVNLLERERNILAEASGTRIWGKGSVGMQRVGQLIIEG